MKVRWGAKKWPTIESDGANILMEELKGLGDCRHVTRRPMFVDDERRLAILQAHENLG